MSHGHDKAVAKLLGQLCAMDPQALARVVLTHNLPARPLVPPPGGWPFELIELFNGKAGGFGANHNGAFSHCHSEFFCVLNPDIELREAGMWQRLLQRAGEPGVGLAYPGLLEPDGRPQQNEREAVTPLALLRRHLLRLPRRRVDWVSGAFWLVSAQAWRSVGGFDALYFMYCEDTDFCLRLQLAGWRLARAETTAVHAAAWASRSWGWPLAWHLRSLLRLWTSAPLWRYVLAARSGGREKLGLEKTGQ